MSRQSEREEFVAVMTAEGVPLYILRQVMSAGRTLQRLAELSCSSEAADRDRVPCPKRYRTEDGCLCRDYGAYDENATTGGVSDPHGDVPRIAVREEQIQRRLVALLERYKVTPIFQGDPRGAVVKLKVPSGRTNDWGNVGVCVP
jgi:hypothetical protein